ncbi:MAG: hypothetical protein ACXVY7_12650 [Gaiellaceae bacterium]
MDSSDKQVWAALATVFGGACATVLIYKASARGDISTLCDPVFWVGVAFGVLSLVIFVALLLSPSRRMPRQPKVDIWSKDLKPRQRVYLQALLHEREGYVERGLRSRVKDVDEQIKLARDKWWEQDPEDEVQFIASQPSTQLASKLLLLSDLIHEAERLYDSRAPYDRWIADHAAWRDELSLALTDAERIRVFNFSGLNEPDQENERDLRPAKVRLDRIIGNLGALYDEYYRGER